MRVALPVLLLTAACGFEPRGAAISVDAADDDGAVADAAEADGAVIDGAVIDGAVIDGAVIDAPPPIDARPPIDAQPIDAPPPIDARPPIDAQPIDAPPACPGYSVVAGAPSRYRRVRTYTDWPAAQADCESDGGYLMIPDSAAEAIAVVDYVGPTAGSPFIWVGVSDTDDDDVWTTVFGATFTPVWGPSQPTNEGGDDYLLVTRAVRYYDWGGTQYYACECDGRVVP